MNDIFFQEQRLKQLPEDIEKLIQQREQNNMNSVHTTKSGKYLRIEVIIESDLRLYAYREKDGFLKKAFYIYFDNENNRVLQRDIIK